MRPDDEAGYFLLETLIAFIIAALAIVVLYRAIFDGAAAISIADQETGALVRAQSRLAALKVALPASGFVKSGADGEGFRYRETAAAMPGQSGDSLQAVALTVSESWGRLPGRSITLNTIIAEPKP
jgi:general secretion pathway protein I